MNEFALEENVDKLKSAILNLIYLKPEERLITPNIINLDDIKECLNNIFKDNSCTDVLFTNNTDKPFFGIHINPLMSSTDAITIIATDEKVKLCKYQIEFDSKLFSLDLSVEEIIAYTLFEISSMMDSYKSIDDVRALFDLYLLSNDDILNLRDSVNYSQLIIYALKDTLYKVSSLLFKESDEELSNNLIISADLLDSLISARNKILSSSFGSSDTLRSPKTIILQWMFTMYKDLTHNSGIVRDTLTDAKEFAGSKLEIKEINRTITAIDQIDSTIVFESVNKFFEKKAMFSLNEISIFKSLKNNGLRSIEDALWEYKLLIKNCETEEDAMYILHGISTRLSILKDYIYNTPDLSESERRHWEAVISEYYSLREQLAKKRIVNKKQYGLFFDYDQLDYLDKNQQEE